MLKFAVALILALAVPSAVSGEEEDAPFPAWLAGAWSFSGEGDRWTEEFWTHPRGGMMIGASREGQGDTLRSWEAIRILRTGDGSLAYVPMPGGGAPVEFQMSDQRAQMIEFANPAHDFPQRIRYWREGDRLNAEIAMIDGSRAIQWSYSPMGE
jgi:hypothetical protein